MYITARKLFCNSVITVMGEICVVGEGSLLLNENYISGVSALGINKYVLSRDVEKDIV